MNHEDIHHIKSELKQAIRDEVLSVKASLKQDMDIRNEMLSSKLVVAIIEESRKLANGLNKRIDETNLRVDELQHSSTLQKGFIGGVTMLGSCVVGVAIWILNKVFP